MEQLAASKQHAPLLALRRLHMDRPVEPDAHHLRDAAGIIAVRLVNLRRERRLHVPRLDAHGRQTCFRERAIEPLRQRSRLEPDTAQRGRVPLQGVDQRRGLARNPRLSDHPSALVDDAEAGDPHGNVQASEVRHGCAPLLLRRGTAPPGCGAPPPGLATVAATPDLSMIAVVGLASRPACSRTAT